MIVLFVPYETSRRTDTYLPIESMIRKNQEEYYKAIQNCNNAGESTEFIEFMLKIIDDTIDELMNSKEIIEETNIADRTVLKVTFILLVNGFIGDFSF